MDYISHMIGIEHPRYRALAIVLRVFAAFAIVTGALDVATGTELLTSSGAALASRYGGRPAICKPSPPCYSFFSGPSFLEVSEGRSPHCCLAPDLECSPHSSSSS
jgi:hypothetical protein